MRHIISRILAILLACALVPSGCGMEDCFVCPTIVSIEGRIEEDTYRVPVENVIVMAGGKSTRTDAAGRFVLEDLLVPYDVVIIPNYARTVWVYRGLRRADPVFLIHAGNRISHRVMVYGNLPAESISGRVGRVVFESRGPIVTPWNDGWVHSDGHYWTLLFWPRLSSPAVQGRLHALIWTTNYDLPSSYDAYGGKDITLSAEQDSLRVDFATSDLRPPETRHVSGSFTPPDGYHHNQRELQVEFGRTTLRFGSRWNLADAFDYLVPAIPGVTLSIHETALSSGDAAHARTSHYVLRGIEPEASGLVVKMDLAPALVSPERAATDVDSSTVFSWTSVGAGGVYFVHVVSPDYTQPEYTIFQSGTSLRLRDIVVHGFGVPHGVAYTWQVGCMPHVGSVDAVATEEFIDAYLRGTGAVTYSEEFDFTTRP